MNLVRAAASLGLGIALIAGAVARAAAHGNDTPPHRMRAVECVSLAFLNQRQVRVYPPAAVQSWHNTDTRNAEIVYWRPVLYRFDPASGQYVVHDDRAGWTPAATTSNGFYDKGWTSKATGGQMQFLPFFVPAGTYTVMHEIFWSSTQQGHAEPAANACTLP